MPNTKCIMEMFCCCTSGGAYLFTVGGCMPAECLIFNSSSLSRRFSCRNELSSSLNCCTYTTICFHVNMTPLARSFYFDTKFGGLFKVRFRKEFGLPGSVPIPERNPELEEIVAQFRTRTWLEYDFKTDRASAHSRRFTKHSSKDDTTLKLKLQRARVANVNRVAFGASERLPPLRLSAVRPRRCWAG